MNIVTNSTPLISLSKIGRISLLQDIFGKVFIPDAVYKVI